MSRCILALACLLALLTACTPPCCPPPADAEQPTTTTPMPVNAAAPMAVLETAPSCCEPPTGETLTTYIYSLPSGAFQTATLALPLTPRATCADWPQLVEVEDARGVRAWVDRAAAGVADVAGLAARCQLQGV